MDAILAIILTIMVLDIKASLTDKIKRINFLFEPLLAYFSTFVIIWVSWYSLFVLMKNVELISYKMYWVSGLWIFLMSIFLIATAWVGQGIMALVPNIFYLTLSIATLIVYHLFMEPEALKHTPENKIPKEKNSRIITIIRVLTILADLFIIWFWPPVSLLTIVYFLHFTCYRTLI